MNNSYNSIKTAFQATYRAIQIFNEGYFVTVGFKAKKKATPFWKSLFLSNSFAIFIFKMVFEICISISWLNFYPFFIFHKPFGTM